MTRVDLWRAANIMRRDDGTNGINEYIEQISWMFFLKVFEDLEKRFADGHALKNKKYDRIIPEKYSWSTWTKKGTQEIIPFIDDELFPFLGQLSGTPEKNTIGLIFSEIRRNKMKSASNLKDVVDIINEIDFNKEEDSHILSQFYEDLLVKLGKESGLAGEFYTPRPVVRFMVKILNPKLNSRAEEIKILDPFCGSCGFLVESYKHIMTQETVPPKEHEKLQKKTFHGYEKKTLPFLVGMMNCILHGLLTPNVSRRNSLNENILKFSVEDKFDYVLTNPPFGGTENKQIQQNFPIKVTSTELLALQQVMRRLKPDGKCGIVLPDGLLSQTNSSFVKVKEELLENYNVFAIISLPPGVFANVTSSGQGPKTSLLFFDKKGPTKKIWYYEIILPKGKHYTKVRTIQDEDLITCYSHWQKNTVSNNSWFTDKEYIVSKQYDLTAKNPKKKEKVNYVSPLKLITDILKQEKDLQVILKILKNNLEK